MSKVVIAGGSGFVGQEVGKRLQEAGYEVVVLSRTGNGGAFRGVKWDGKTLGDWVKELDGAKAILNYCGAPIVKKWTDSYKRVLRESRLDPTTVIGQAINQCSTPPEVWMNASAIGFYGDGGSRSLSECSPAGEGFMGELCVEWENAVHAIATPKTRKVIARLGIVLGEDGGAFPLFKKLTNFGIGGAVGSGDQYMSWIHIDDVTGMTQWMLESEVSGVVNVVSPEPETNADFMKAMRDEVGRPPVPAAPAFLMKTFGGLAGIEAETILQGQRVYPVIAEGHGYVFRFETLEAALGDLLGSREPKWAQASS